MLKTLNRHRPLLSPAPSVNLLLKYVALVSRLILVNTIFGLRIFNDKKPEIFFSVFIQTVEEIIWIHGSQ